MLTEDSVLNQTRLYVENLFEKQDLNIFQYHNLQHTREVVEAVKELGSAAQLSEKKMEMLLIAAWFHDVGVAPNCPNHEEVGENIAQEFLTAQQYSANKIEKVLALIQATKMPQNPQSELENIICDADLWALGSKVFFERTEQLRLETAILAKKTISLNEWTQINIDFLSTHQYFTEYARQNWEIRKQKNLKKLKKDALILNEYQTKIQSLEAENQKLKEKISENKNKKPERGVETLFRTTSNDHLALSQMADQKANIMISINSIIVGLVVSVLIRKFEEYPNLIIPTIILTTTCLVAIVFAVLATRPNVTTGTFNPEDVSSQKTNLLFFGNFHKMPLADYQAGMFELMKNNDLLYASMINDIYYLGKVLGRKYELIRISFTVFMFGFVISVLSYAIAVIFFPVD